jgi:polyisoprenoid-binding protein YceI
MITPLFTVVSHSLLAGVMVLSLQTPALPGAGNAATTDRQVRRITLTVAPTGNEARYRVREQLVGVEFPNDAVGKTSNITGSLVFESNGRIVKEQSKFTVDLASITSDSDRRDNYVRNNTLRVSEFPTVAFVPSSATGLPASLPAAADLAFKLTGDLTVAGVTKPATWDVTGKMLATGEFTGTATTSFNFAEFGLTIPRVRTVLSVVDNITLEFDLHLIPAPASR